MSASSDSPTVTSMLRQFDQVWDVCSVHARGLIGKMFPSWHDGDEMNQMVYDLASRLQTWIMSASGFINNAPESDIQKSLSSVSEFIRVLQEMNKEVRH